MRKQVAALPVRWTDDDPRVLLVTSRETQRWIIPKGWPMRGRSDARAAAQEAVEEAGVRGRVRSKPIGSYHYLKRRPDGADDCEVAVYLLQVAEELDAFPEMAERQRQWFSLAEAAEIADDEGLREILRRFEAARPDGAKGLKKLAKVVAGKIGLGKASDAKASDAKAVARRADEIVPSGAGSAADPSDPAPSTKVEAFVGSAGEDEPETKKASARKSTSKGTTGKGSVAKKRSVAKVSSAKGSTTKARDKVSGKKAATGKQANAASPPPRVSSAG